jgi:hypothetical protein
MNSYFNEKLLFYLRSFYNKMLNFICDSIEGQNILPSIEEQILNRIITFYVYWSPPFINYRYDDKSMICGPFIKFLRELSIKHNYRFVIAINFL